MRRDGERVRITAQLIRVRDQMDLWAENYDRQLPGILEEKSDRSGHGKPGAIAVDGGREKSNFPPERSLRPESARPISRGGGITTPDNQSIRQKTWGAFTEGNRARSLPILSAFGARPHTFGLCALGRRCNDPELSLPSPCALELDAELRGSPQLTDASTSLWFDWDFKGAEPGGPAGHRIERKLFPR